MRRRQGAHLAVHERGLHLAVHERGQDARSHSNNMRKHAHTGHAHLFLNGQPFESRVMAGVERLQTK